MNNKVVSWEEAVAWLKAQPEHQDLVKACYYDDPLHDAAERFYCSIEWSAVRGYLENNLKGRALDIGAGRGISSFALARDGWRVTALEPDPSVLVGGGAIRKLSVDFGVRIDVLESAGEHLPFEDGIMDLVFCRQTLHHAADLRRFCHEVSRVLKPGGIFMAVREHVISRKDDLNVFLGTHLLHNLYGGENAFLLEEYVGAIESSGIRLRNVLNPYDSEINLYPETKTGLKKALAKRLFLWNEKLLPDVALHLLGSVLTTPGRLYSFIGEKI